MSDRAVVTPLWVKVAEEFRKDHNMYPSKPLSARDARRAFHLKYASCFFDVAPKPSRPIEHYIQMFVVAQAAVQLLAVEKADHPQGQEISRQSDVRVNSIIQVRGWRDPSEAHHAHQLLCRGPLNTTIHYRDQLSGNVVKYLVVDRGATALKGTFYELQDEAGHLKTVTEEELDAMRFQ